MNATMILARKLRLAVVTNVYNQGFIDADQAKELLSGPLTPNDDNTTVDDSALFGDPNGLDKIESESDE